MKVISLKKWDSSPRNTYNYKLVTKLTDLGSPDAYKTILGYYFNINKTSNYDILSSVSIYMSISYRTSTGDSWHSIGDSPTISARGTTLIENIFTTPIKNIKQIQLKIEGGWIKGNISINDFGFFYRKYRGSSASDLNE